MKFIKIIAALALSATCLLSAVGCDSESNVTYVGIDGVAINEKGELIVTYGDGLKSNLGVVVGKDGVDGIDGVDGKDGKDGADGKDGLNGADGKNGEDGKDGLNGADGKDGKDGEDGKDGAIVISGGSSNTVFATAKGLLSSVSVYCQFTSSTDGEAEGSSGSGVIYKLDKNSGDAYIITNYHVVHSNDSNEKISENINVMLYGSEYSDYMIPATYVGGSMNYDIAVLRVEGSELLKGSDVRQVEMADSDKAPVGSCAIAIGNAESRGIAATLGSVNTVSEYLGMLGSDGKTDISLRVMRIDTAVNHGNSGGGLFNGDGNLIGIVSAKLSDVDIDNMGYAIPSNLVRVLADNIIDNKDTKAVIKPTIGVEVIVHEPHAEYDEQLGQTVLREQIKVTNVVSGGLAESAGILKDDIILSVTIRGEKIEFTRQYQLIDSILRLRIGDSFITTVERADADGEKTLVDIEITVTEDSVVFLG